MVVKSVLRVEEKNRGSRLQQCLGGGGGDEGPGGTAVVLRFVVLQFYGKRGKVPAAGAVGRSRRGVQGGRQALRLIQSCLEISPGGVPGGGKL